MADEGGRCAVTYMHYTDSIMYMSDLNRFIKVTVIPGNSGADFAKLKLVVFLECVWGNDCSECHQFHC